MDAVVKLEACASCGQMIDVHPGYVKWCEHCLDNVKGNKSEEQQSRLERMYTAFGERAGKALYEKEHNRRAEKPAFTVQSAMAYILATGIHLISAILLLLAVYLFIAKTDSIAAIVSGFLLLGVSWLARPRLPGLEKGEHILTREDLPELYEVLDRLCADMGSRQIDGIILNGEYNASIQMIGIKNKVILRLGLPLLSVLEEQETAALIGHEIGHLINGDLTRKSYIGYALFTVYTWIELLEPTSEQMQFEYTVLEWVSAYVQKLLAFFPKVLFYSLLYLLFHNSQRAEYFADDVAAKVAGREASISLMEKLGYDPVYYYAIRKAALTAKQSFFDILTEQFADMPDKEKRRLHKIGELEKSKIDDTHPPTCYRINYLKSRDSRVPIITPDSGKMNKIKQELAPYQPDIGRGIVEEYRYDHA